jgi:DNA-binding NarL/FixJ family response regulator
VGPVRVLIVDDFVPVRILVASILNEDPEIVIAGECSDGREAVEQCSKLAPDVVIMDIGLAKLNGLEAAKQIREKCPGTKIVFLSNQNDPEVIRELLRIGAGFVWKPDASRDLLSAVKAASRNETFVRFKDIGRGQVN